MPAFHNEGLYRELSIPFETVEDANDNITQFCDALYELRKKHRIRDLLFVIRVGCKREDDESDATIVNYFGNSLSMEGIAAYAYGQLSGERQEMIAEEIKHAAKAIRNQKRRK